MISGSQKQFIQRNLLRWYHRHARPLPWRSTKDPYKIWVSEMMLQQTQVKTVIPYYRGWIKRFPTIQKLAKASLQDVMKHWAGLGYYRRARMIHEGARKIVCERKGKLPSHAADLEKLPGIGRYTAGAIASISFEKQTPVLDGNVIRVLTRVFGIKADVTRRKTKDDLWDLAALLVPLKYPGDYNQALMELGATLCVPDHPRCMKCPLKRICKANLEKNQLRYPVKSKRDSLIKKRTYAVILRKNKKVLIQKQARHERWGGLWMFPYWENRQPIMRHRKPILTIHHGYTKYRVRLDVYENANPDRFRNKRLRSKSTKWVNLTRLKTYPFPSPHQKIVNHLLTPNAS